jgi:uncharacterized damage-inducible protein DinB
MRADDTNKEGELMGEVQQNASRVSKTSLDFLIKSVKAMPEEKLDWVPGGKARSALAIMQEVAYFPSWLVSVLRGDRQPEDADAAAEAFAKEHDTLDKLIAAAEKNTDELCKFIETLPDERLDKPVKMPWGDQPTSSVIYYHEWNNTYHLGQVSYIQLMYGDEEMYF